MTIENRIVLFENRLLELGNLTKQAMTQATEAFKNQDKELALTIVERDEYINYTEQIINDEAIEILTLMQPVARDLRFLIGGIKIAKDLERIADYAKNIGRFVIKTKSIEQKYQDEILKLMDIFFDNFTEVLNVLSDREIKEAYRVASLDDKLDLQFEEFVKFLASNLSENLDYPVELSNIASNIERAGDHSKNICEQIIYVIKGHLIDFG